MKKLKVIIILGLFISCSNNDHIVGHGEIETREISLNQFKGINNNGTHEVYISFDEEQKVEVTGYRNIINRLKTDVHNSIWDIELTEGNYRNAGLTIHITVPILNRAVLNGSGDIFIYDFKSNRDIYSAIFGSGNIEIFSNFGCTDLRLRIDGSGKIYVKDEFENLEDLNIIINGSGNISAFPMNTDTCEIEIIGSGNCEVSVDSQLDIEIEGSGRVTYIGNPAITTNITGSGKVIQN